MLALDLSANDELDVGAADMLGELANALGADGIELRLAVRRAGPLGVLTRSGLAARVQAYPTLDAAVADR